MNADRQLDKRSQPGSQQNGTPTSATMSKKTSKKIALLNAKLQKMELRLAGVRRQCDDPTELTALEREIAVTRAALDRCQTESDS